MGFGVEFESGRRDREACPISGRDVKVGGVEGGSIINIVHCGTSHRNTKVSLTSLLLFSTTTSTS
jgi:hypothetical protein